MPYNNFFCKLCSYKTDRKDNYNRHNKSKKHSRNLEACDKKNSNKIASSEKETRKDTVRQETPECARKNGFFCKYCGITFTRSNGLSKHQNKCKQRLDEIKEIKYKQELEKHKELLKEKEKQLNEQKVEKEYYKQLIDNYSKMGPKTFNSITYVMNKYENAPHIKKIEPEKIEYFQNINMTKVENMVSDYRNNRFVTFIINTIISIHKKDNPEDQSIWSTDSSRYNYLIKELLENEGSYWIVDKKGAKSKDYLVEPILKFIREEIINYNELASEALMDENLPKSRFSIITDTQKDGIDIIKDIDDGELAAEIIRKMAKHFHHKSKEGTPLIEEIE